MIFDTPQGPLPSLMRLLIDTPTTRSGPHTEPPGRRVPRDGAPGRNGDHTAQCHLGR